MMDEQKHQDVLDAVNRSSYMCWLTADDDDYDRLVFKKGARKQFQEDVYSLAKYCQLAIQTPQPETVEEQEISDIISKSFSSKVSSDTCEAAAHNLRVFFPNGLRITKGKPLTVLK